MRVKQERDGAEKYLLLDGAHCEADDYKRDPRDIKKCSMGFQKQRAIARIIQKKTSQKRISNEIYYKKNTHNHSSYFVNCCCH